MRRPHRNQRGFTLIELMITVAIVGIMSTLAISLGPSLRRQQDFRRLTREVFNSMQTARSEAIRRGTKVHMTISPLRVTVFMDTTPNNAYNLDEYVLYEYPRRPSTFADDVTLTSDFTDVGGQPIIVFDERGLVLTPSLTPGSGTVTITDAQIGRTAFVDLTLAGAMRIRK